MKRKFIIVMLSLMCVVCLAFALTACDGNSNTDDNKQNTEQTGDNGGESTHSHVEAEAVKENEIAATCSTTGSYDSVVYCSVCNEELSRETISIPKTEHTYNTGVITAEPTCNTKGIKTYTCTVCGNTYTETIAANGHTYNSDKVCTVCGAEKVSEGLDYTISADKTYYTVSGIGTCTDTDLIIPSIYNNLPVTEIGEYAFNSCTSIISVTIPDSITSIGEYAFIYCYRLVEVYNLSSLKIVAGSRAQGYAGYYAKNVYTATEGESRLFTQDNCLFIYDADDNYYLVSYEGTETDITLPALANGFAINSYAFYCNTEITSVVIPDNVTAIGDYSFYDCTSLKEINIPDSVLTIGIYAFENCTAATKLSIGCGVTDIGYKAFYDCTALEQINYNAILAEDFGSNDNIFINAGIKGNGIVLIIGENVTRIPANLFKKDSYIAFRIVGEESAANLTTIEFKENSKCESIGEYAFEGCDNLESITIPNSVVAIGLRAFCRCVSLNTVLFETNSNCESIGAGAFYDCTSLKEIKLPNNITKINNSLFYDCYSLESIVIPSSINYIGTYAFYGCDSISITFENTSGWYVTETEWASSGTDVDVTDADKNATYFKDTYCSYYWYRSDN